MDVAVVQESKLNETSKTPQFQGYTVVRKDRECGRSEGAVRGGGLLTLVRDSIPYKRNPEWGDDNRGLESVDRPKQEGENTDHERVQATH